MLILESLGLIDAFESDRTMFSSGIEGHIYIETAGFTIVFDYLEILRSDVRSEQVADCRGIFESADRTIILCCRTQI
jgi:hypothetical protein